MAEDSIATIGAKEGISTGSFVVKVVVAAGAVLFVVGGTLIQFIAPLFV